MIGAMPNVQQDQEHLAQAARPLAEGQRRVAEKIATIRHMTERGRIRPKPSAHFGVSQEALEICRAHRQLILDTIARG